MTQDHEKIRQIQNIDCHRELVTSLTVMNQYTTGTYLQVLVMRVLFSAKSRPGCASSMADVTSRSRCFSLKFSPTNRYSKTMIYSCTTCMHNCVVSSPLITLNHSLFPWALKANSEMYMTLTSMNGSDTATTRPRFRSSRRARCLRKRMIAVA